MNDSTKRFVNTLKRDIAQWEETAIFLEDPHIESIEDVTGAKQDKMVIAARYRALAAEYRELLSRLTNV